MTGVALLTTSCTVIAQYDHRPFKETPIRVRPLQLPNGLQVIIEEDSGSPMVGVALMVGAGAWDDPVGKEGLAHFVEHLAFRARLPSGQNTLAALEAAGMSEYNGLTDADTTTFMAEAPREAVSALIAVAARQLERVGALELAEFEVERKVVEAELRLKTDTAHGRKTYRWLQQALYPVGSVESRPIIGTGESLRTLTPEDVQAFQAAHYGPANATLVITGGVSAAAVDAAISQAFPTPAVPATHQAMPHPSVMPPEAPPNRLQRHEAPLSNDRLFIAWSLPSRFAHPATAGWLDRAVSHWVGQFVVEEAAIMGADCGVHQRLRGGELLCEFALRSGTDPQRIFDFVVGRLENKISLGGFNSTPTPNTKPTVVTARLSAIRRAVLRAHKAQVDGELSLNTKNWAPVSAAECARELRWITRERARAVSVTPGGVRAADDSEVNSVPVSTSGRDANPNLTAAQVAQLAKHLGTDHAELEQLANGLQVAVLKAKHLPLISVALVLPGGTALSDPAGLAELGLALGKTNVSGLDFPTGAIHRRFQTPDGLYYVLQGQPQHLESMFQWLRYTMQGVWHVDSGRLDWLRFLFDSDLDQQEKRPLVRASREFSHSLWQGHPYGEAVTRRAIDEPNTLQIEAWLNRLYGPNQSVLAVVGDVDVEQTLSQVREIFAQLPKRAPIPPPPVPVPHGGGGKVLAVATPGMTEVGLTWGCQVANPGPRQEAITRLLATWLDRQLTWRLREQGGLTYTSHVSSTSMWGGAGALFASLEANGRDLGEVMKQLRLVMSGADLSKAQLLSAAWDTLRQRNGTYESSSAIAVDLARDTRNGWPLTSRDDAPGIMTSVTVDEVRAALASCLSADVTLLNGDPALLEAGLREGGLGPPQFVH